MSERKHSIQICLGSSCFSRGNEDCLEYIKQYLTNNKLKDIVDFRGHLCVEQCKCGPNLKIDDTTYHEVCIQNIEAMLNKHFKNEQV
jgi:NADH:ubiquinone oxidoreductase subunit E